MRRGHATRLPKPPYADSRRHPGVNASIFARAPRGNRRPELSAILSLCLWRPAGRSQSCLHTPIRTPVSLHRNLPAEVLRRPIESAIVVDVINAVRHRAFQLGINEVMYIDLFGCAFGSPFAARILEIADQLLLFR